MIKVPVGKLVTVDLWNSQKKHGMVKYRTNTENFVKAKSNFFNLKKGDSAIVIESHDYFVLIIPKDQFTDLFKNYRFKSINFKKLAQMIYNILKKREKDGGGILSLDEIFIIFKQTSIRDYITKKQLVKAIKSKHARFDILKEENSTFLALSPVECVNDGLIVLEHAKDYPFITFNMLQSYTSWSYLRIRRILEYFTKTGRCRKEENYRKGDRYYFQ